jgi:hypothetical protein
MWKPQARLLSCLYSSNCFMTYYSKHSVPNTEKKNHVSHIKSLAMCETEQAAVEIMSVVWVSNKFKLYEGQHHFCSFVSSCHVDLQVNTNIPAFGETYYLHNEDGCLLGCCTVQSGRVVPTFQRSLLPPASGRCETIWNVGTTLPNYTVLQPRRQPSSYSPPWKPQILHTISIFRVEVTTDEIKKRLYHRW